MGRVFCLPLNQQNGAALTIVLIFSSVLSLLAIFMLDQALLNTKMDQAFTRIQQQQMKNEQQLRILEQAFYAEPLEFEKTGEAKWKGFIPDNLAFGEKAGLTLYELSTANLQTIQAIRFKQADSFPNNVFKLENGQWVAVAFDSQAGQPVLQVQAGDEYQIIIFPKGTPQFKSETVLLAVDLKHRGIADKLFIADQNGQIWSIDLTEKLKDWQPIRWQHVNGSVIDLFAGDDPLHENFYLIAHLQKGSHAVLQAMQNGAIVWSKAAQQFQSLHLRQHWVEADIQVFGETEFEKQLIDRFTGEPQSPELLRTLEGRRSWREIN